MSDNNDNESFVPWTSVGEQWMTLEELRESFHQDWDYADDPDAWLHIGAYRGQPVYLSHDRARTHVLLVGAGTRGNTAQGLTDLYHHFHDIHLSFVFFDPTSELKRLLAPRLSKTHKIWEIALEAPERSLKYNPLAHIPGAGSPRGDRYAAAYALASVYLRYISPTFPERFICLDRHVQSLVTACILHLTTTPPGAPFQALAALLLKKVLLFPTLIASPDRQAREIAQQLQFLSDDYRDALSLALAQSASRLAQAPARNDIDYLTARNDIDFTEMLQEPVALFYTLPPFDMQDWQLLSALLYQQLTAALVDIWPDLSATANRAGEVAGPRGIRIVIDQPEMLGPLPKLERDVDGWPDRAVNISFVLGIRERGVLEKLYGQNARDMLSAFRTHIVLPGTSPADSHFYATLYGDFLQAVDTDELVITRPLITPAELSRLKNGRALLCPLDLPPAIITYP